jgi:hypothetical protein
MEKRKEAHMNTLQRQLADVIIRLASMPGFDEAAKSSAVRYGFLNYVAKYSLARDRYYITETAWNHLQHLDLVSAKGLLRGSKSKKRKFTYEHPIPSNIVANEILANPTDRTHIEFVLRRSDYVTVLTEGDNKKLGGKLVKSMPLDWSFYDSSVFARYELVGIDIHQESRQINVYGVIAR